MRLVVFGIVMSSLFIAIGFVQDWCKKQDNAERADVWIPGTVLLTGKDIHPKTATYYGKIVVNNTEVDARSETYLNRGKICLDKAYDCEYHLFPTGKATFRFTDEEFVVREVRVKGGRITKIIGIVVLCLSLFLLTRTLR